MTNDPKDQEKRERAARLRAQIDQLGQGKTDTGPRSPREETDEAAERTKDESEKPSTSK